MGCNGWGVGLLARYDYLPNGDAMTPKMKRSFFVILNQCTDFLKSVTNEIGILAVFVGRSLNYFILWRYW